MKGTIVVNGILASCYAFPDHDFANIGMMPVRWFPEVMEWLFGVEDESPGYVMIAEHIAQVLPYNLLY